MPKRIKKRKGVKRFKVDRIPLDKGGYARHGRDYYGIGQKLYSVYDTVTRQEQELRASSAKAARKLAVEDWEKRGLLKE
jgi:hypothetical protein